MRSTPGAVSSVSDCRTWSHYSFSADRLGKSARMSTFEWCWTATNRRNVRGTDATTSNQPCVKLNKTARPE